VAAAVKHGIVPVICVGETAEDLAQYGPSAIPVQQLRGALSGIARATDIVVAYEPVWAIGSGQAATPEQAEQVCAALREVVAAVLGDEVAAATRILYGGSVKASNIASFMRQSNVDGALVGGASLDIGEFASIAQFLKHVGT
jgi:triosephosphate isomerase